MQWPGTLRGGRLLGRRQRFFADVLLDGETTPVVVHCANTGSMRTAGEVGMRVYLLEKPAGKLRYSWELSDNGTGGLIGVNTARPNQLMEEFLRAQGLAGYLLHKKEATFAAGVRFDFCLQQPVTQQKLWLEVKNVTLRDPESGLLLFPDSPSERGQKHLRHLMQAREQGDAAGIVYVLNRPDGRGFAPAARIDPVYADLAAQAQSAGVKVFLASVHASLTAGLQISQVVEMQGPAWGS